MIGRSKFYADFTREDVDRLTAFMHVYRASAGQTIIHEGDVDDYMILIIEGRVEIVKTDSQGNHRPMTAVGPGATLGELIDNLEAAHPGIKAQLVEDGRMKPGVAAVCGHAETRQGLLQKLNDDVEVHFVPAISGG